MMSEFNSKSTQNQHGNYELEPCPFCGGTKLKIDQKTSSTTKWNSETKRCDKLVVVTVRCNKCHTRGPTTSMYAHWGDRPTKILEEKAVEVWNTRTPKERGGEK